MKGYLKYILQLLQEAGVLAEAGSYLSLDKEKLQLFSHIWDDLVEVYQDLGGVRELPPLKPRQADFTVLDTFVVLDTELDYNRYRIQTFRADFYDETEFPVSTWRQQARDFEKECLKSGTVDKLWLSPPSEHHFGKSEAPGDLGLNGSSVWKMRAYKNMLLDFTCYEQRKKLLRLSIFDKLMIAGKVFYVKDLLLTRQPENAKYLTNYLLRKLEIHRATS